MNRASGTKGGTDTSTATRPEPNTGGQRRVPTGAL